MFRNPHGTWGRDGIRRSINRNQVKQVRASIDQRSLRGRPAYTMLLLLPTYGLPACEVALRMQILDGDNHDRPSCLTLSTFAKDATLFIG